MQNATLWVVPVLLDAEPLYVREILWPVEVFSLLHADRKPVSVSNLKPNEETANIRLKPDLLECPLNFEFN